jgi:uncharacterized protein with HEPN domain
MSEPRSDRLYLDDIMDSIQAIETYIESMDYKHFINDGKTYTATIRELEIIGEATAKVSDDVKGRYPEIPWQQIKAFRNKIVHEYFGIEFEILWDIVKNELPFLKDQINKDRS